jgi:hypothetical protein
MDIWIGRLARKSSGEAIGGPGASCALRGEIPVIDPGDAAFAA